LQEELLRCIASLNARLAIAEEGGVVRVASARDDELKQALKAMERRLEMRAYLRKDCAAFRATSDVCVCRPEFGVPGIQGQK
jgi:hypothetical protein